MSCTVGTRYKMAGLETPGSVVPCSSSMDSTRDSLEIVSEFFDDDLADGSSNNQGGMSYFPFDMKSDVAPHPELYQSQNRKRYNDEDVRNSATNPAGTSVPSKQSRVLNKSSTLLQMFTQRLCLMFHFRRCCTGRLFNDPGKFKKEGEDVLLRFRMCQSCTKGNLDMAETYQKYFASRLRNSQESDDALARSIKNKKLNGLWRLFRMKYTLTIHPCHKCSMRLKNDSMRVYMNDDGDAECTLRLCNTCADGNMRLAQQFINKFTDAGDDD